MHACLYRRAGVLSEPTEAATEHTVRSWCCRLREDLLDEQRSFHPSGIIHTLQANLKDEPNLSLHTYLERRNTDG